MAESTYKFSYAIQCLRDAIDYAQTDGDFQQARIWSNRVEAAYNADITSADEGLRLMHSLATKGEQSVLSRLDGGADIVDAQRWRDEKPTAREIALPNGKLRSYASYNNTGKAQTLAAEDVDGELLGE